MRKARAPITIHAWTEFLTEPTPFNLNSETIDLTTVPANTLALLSFDLLGFGSQNGYVTIDDVRLFTDNNTPIATTATARPTAKSLIIGYCTIGKLWALPTLRIKC
jgi:hypothetical protein